MARIAQAGEARKTILMQRTAGRFSATDDNRPHCLGNSGKHAPCRGRAASAIPRTPGRTKPPITRRRVKLCVYVSPLSPPSDAFSAYTAYSGTPRNSITIGAKSV
jgi:hypothetical protein